MSSSPADRAFARFCRTGDADALAAVFDATAPRLAVLAGHLAPGDAATVDDLVQSTFVEAIRSAPRFTPGRPVLPWLVTILGRRAARLRRERGARPRIVHGDDTLAALVAEAPDPARLAADAEAAAEVAAAIDRLDRPYRQVVALRLVHGMTPVEIARALDRPLGTVHAQWHRGADKLRRMLPAGLAVAIAGLLPAPSLAAARAVVLEAARQSSGHAVAGSALGGLLGVLMMKKTLITAAVLLMAALAVPFLLTPPVAAPESIGVSRERPVDEVAALDVDPAAGRTPTEAAPARRAAVTANRPFDVTFRGRVVAHESGQPIAGATVRGRVRPWLEQIRPLPPEQLEAATTEATATTDADGRFAIRLTPLPDRAFDLSVAAPGRARLVAWWEHPLRPGAIVDSGEIPMALGAEVTLRVVDQDRAPVAGFELQMREPEAGPRSSDGAWSTPNFTGTQTTGPDGRTPPSTLIAGRYSIQYAEGTGHRLVGPDGFVVPTDRTQLTVDVHVEAPGPDETVGGVVVDTDGRPVVGAEVFVRQSTQTGYRTEKTFGGGRFRIPGILPERGPARVVRVGAGSGDLPLEYRIVSPKSPQVLAGSDDLRLVVAPVETVTRQVRIVDGRDRRPLTSFHHGIAIVTEDDHGIRFGDMIGGFLPAVGLDAEHPEGLVEFTAPRGWKTLLTVVPGDPELAPVAFFPLDPGVAGDGVHEVLVPPAQTRVVRVTTADGTPVAGSSVEWIQPIGHRYPRAWITPLDDLLNGRGGATYIDVRIDRGETDADGTARLRVSADTTGCRLCVRGATHLETYVRVDADAAPDASIAIIVEPAARLTGTVTPLDLLAALGPDAGARAAAAVLIDPEQELVYLRPELELRGTSPTNDDVDVELPIPDDGRFAFDGLPPGDYRLTLSAWNAVRGELPQWHVERLVVGETRHIDLDVAAHAPARIHGRVLVNGAPPARKGHLRLGSGRVDVAAGGRFDAALWPGRYPLQLVQDADPAMGWDVRLLAPDTLDVVAGEERVITLDFERRTLRITVRSASGTPAAGAWLMLLAEEPEKHSAHLRRLDANGQVTVIGSWRETRRARLFTVHPLGATREEALAGAIELGIVEFPAGETEADLVLRAPATADETQDSDR